jgi:hypothetical protein
MSHQQDHLIACALSYCIGQAQHDQIASSALSSTRDPVTQLDRVHVRHYIDCARLHFERCTRGLDLRKFHSLHHH